MNDSTIVEVVAGVCVRDGRLLLQQRSRYGDFPWMWECPGGKVEGNESHHAALRREWNEELALVPHNITEVPVWSGWFENAVTRPDRSRVFVLFYRCTIVDEPTRCEGEGYGWFSYHECLRLSMSPANEAALSTIMKLVWSSEVERQRAALDENVAGTVPKPCGCFGSSIEHQMNCKAGTP